jgi:hypothetical protein
MSRSTSGASAESQGPPQGLDHHRIHVDVISSSGREGVDIVGIVEVIVDTEHKRGRQIL